MRRGVVVRWLESRRPAPPGTLARHLAAAVTDSPADLPDHLIETGRRLLGRVVADPDGGRELALDLLAADALVTYAFEAQAEQDVNGLGALVTRVAGGDRGER